MYRPVPGFEELQKEWHEIVPQLVAGAPDRTDFMLPLSRIGIDEPVKEEFTMKEVAWAVAEETGVSLEMMRGQRRHGTVVRARHLALWLMTCCCHHRTQTEIAGYFRRDHTTLRHAKVRMRQALGEDAELRKLRDRCLARLRGAR